MDIVHALIIDDDKDTANLFRMVLRMVGFECEAAYSAKAAFAYLASKVPDIVLLDLRLGLELDGTDILYQIRSNPRFAKTRVIVITSFPRMLDEIENVADLTLLKPVEIEDLTTLASRLTQIQPKSFLYRNPATNLYSLNFFMTRLEHAYERSKRRPEFLFAVMAIRFIFDLQGEGQLQEEESEWLLMHIARILNKDFRPTDTFGYLNNQRAVALYEDFKDPGDIYIVIRRLRDDLSVDIESSGKSWHCTPIIGAVLNDSRFNSAEAILKAATDALEQVSIATGDYFRVADPF